ncbi:hypothetical protein WH96_01430 [Kiloniella spongiae]|uniref:Uncharacterized protein n=1 Tax=Kiloniella spongiae TaxID=1489064 RepID=A0A0H2MI00_9PROT|nr:hypothetical protein [Kiloniella spongiae]KLN62214.1 hypothetical protein WH96_01430 [Kiloniella spongiae]
MKKRLLSSCAVLIVLSLNACGTPDFIHVRKGVNPENQDTNVRFRTTYYFRVFDVCGGLQPDDSKLISNGAKTSSPFVNPIVGGRILTDSLYRFRMTGKANALASEVKFESGTLRKQEIDPFGATIQTHKETGQPQFVSRKQAEARSFRKDAEHRLDKLLALYKELNGEAAYKNIDAEPAESVTIRKIIQQEIKKTIIEMVKPPIESETPDLVDTENSLARLADESVALAANASKVQGNLGEKVKAAKMVVTSVPDVPTAEAKKKAKTAYSDALTLISQSHGSLDSAKRSLNNLASIINRSDRSWYLAEMKSITTQIASLKSNAEEIKKELEKLSLKKAKIKFSANPIPSQDLLLPKFKIDQIEFEFIAKDKTPIGRQVVTGSNLDETLMKLVETMNHDADFKKRFAAYTDPDNESIWIIPFEMQQGGAFNLVYTLPEASSPAQMSLNQEGWPDKAVLKAVGVLTDKAVTNMAIGASSSQGLSNLLKKEITSQLSNASDNVCSKGFQRRRGFQVLGPEGWRTFDQDERLIMAMTSSAKPLISSLKKVSDQVLKQEATSSAQILPLVQEQLNISKAKRVVDRTSVEKLDSNTVQILIDLLRGEKE